MGLGTGRQAEGWLMALRWDREGPGSPGVRGGGVGEHPPPVRGGGGDGCDVEEPQWDSADPGSGPT